MNAQEASSPLTVLVAGAGIAGLTAAVCLRKQGHRVLVFEKSSTASDIGAAITVQPNCHGILKRLALDPAAKGGNICVGIDFHAADGKRINRFNYGIDILQKFKHDWYLIHRRDLHDGLKELATSTSEDGPPAEVHTSLSVVHTDAENATLTLSSGGKLSGDVVLGADGSTCRGFLSSTASVTPRPFGKSLFRFMIPRSALLADARCSKFFEEDGRLRVIVAADRRIVLYPCSKNTEVNVLVCYPSAEDDDRARGAPVSDKEHLLAVCRPFSPEIQAMTEHAVPAALRAWKLMDMERLPALSRARLAVIGDAAHPFLPWLGQGGAQAIEDAASIAAMLPRGTSPAAVPARLKLYEEARADRAATIQQYTRINGRDPGAPREPGEEHMTHMDFMTYNLGHDEWEHSRAVLAKAAREGRA